MKRKRTLPHIAVIVIVILIILAAMVMLFGCGYTSSQINSLNGSITGNTYECQFYSNDGMKFMTAEGERIDINSNIIKEATYNDSGWGYIETLSSVITITIDGSEMESCGTTILFVEKGLKPDIDFMAPDIYSSAHGIGDMPIIANVVNKYSNLIGKPRAVVIQSQLGDPICAFSGQSVYSEVCGDLPKTTKLMIDGKALYIHRGNFQIIDKELID